MREDGWAPWLPRRAATDLPGLATVIGHRGAAGRAPENTLAGLREGARARRPLGRVRRHAEPGRRAGADPRRDPAAHDRTAAAACRATTAAELRRLDAGAWFAPEFAGERDARRSRRRWPSCSSSGCTPTSRSSPPPGHEVATGEVVGATLQRYWPAAGPAAAAVELRARRRCAAARRVAPGMPRGLLAGRAARRLGGGPAATWAARRCTSDHGRVTPRPCCGRWRPRACRCCSTR